MIRLKGIHIIIDDEGDGSTPRIQREYMTVQEDGVVRDIPIDRATRDTWLSDTRDATVTLLSEAKTEAATLRNALADTTYAYEDLRTAANNLLSTVDTLRAENAELRASIDPLRKAAEDVVNGSA